MYFPYRDETKELNDDTRRSSIGSFVQLPDGITHYELGGDDIGQPVILIHGFSVPYFIYDPTFEYLTRSGFRVLRYDLFGRGLSDRPQVNYNLDFFIKQLVHVVEALHITQPVNLIGLSMGGPIAAAFITRYPLRVNKLILIDPIGAKPVAFTPLLKALRMPILGELGLGLAGSRSMARNIAADFFDPGLIQHLESKYEAQMYYKGFRRAILSTLRNNMLGSFIDVYEQLGKMHKDILLFWGRNDTTVPFEHSVALCAALSNAQFHVIENCGHVPHYERPDEVNPILLEFLRKNDTKIS